MSGENCQIRPEDIHIDDDDPARRACQRPRRRPALSKKALLAPSRTSSGLRHRSFAGRAVARFGCGWLRNLSQEGEPSREAPPSAEPVHRTPQAPARPSRGRPPHPRAPAEPVRDAFDANFFGAPFLDARLVRSQVLSLRERGYVRMALLSGMSSIKIIFFEMLPNMLPWLMAAFTLIVSDAILTAASLEALGLGPARIPTLGTTIYNAINSSAIIRGMWWWWGSPIVALILIFVSLFLITTGLDEIANPRLQGASRK